jgi:hypothetical protein
MMCCVITRYHPMVGCDIHTAFPTPIPVPFMPHIVFAVARLGFWWMAKPKESPTVNTAAGPPLATIFDIGMLIPHIGPNIPLRTAFLMLTSSSQGHFGVHSVQIDTNSGEGPIAVALQLFVNPQLNCNDLGGLTLGLPTGALFAPNTVVAGLTLGDLLAGVLSMLLTSLTTMVLGKLTDLAGGALMRQLNTRMPAWLLSKLPRISLGPYSSEIVKLLKGWSIGSPMGYSSTTDPDAAVRGPFDAPFGSSSWIEGISGGAGSAVDSVATPSGLNDYFNDVALLPVLPLAAPLPGAIPIPASAVEQVLPLAATPISGIKNLGDGIDGLLPKL